MRKRERNSGHVCASTYLQRCTARLAATRRAATPCNTARRVATCVAACCNVLQRERGFPAACARRRTRRCDGLSRRPGGALAACVQVHMNVCVCVFGGGGGGGDACGCACDCACAYACACACWRAFVCVRVRVRACMCICGRAGVSVLLPVLRRWPAHTHQRLYAAGRQAGQSHGVKRPKWESA